MTMGELYDCINHTYGESRMWISDIAKSLGITYSAARHVVSEAGYYRHKRVRQISLSEFGNMPYAQYIQSRL